VRLTSESLTLNRVLADTASLSADGTQIVTENLKLNARTQDERPVEATAPAGTVNIGGKKSRGEPLPAPSLEELRTYHNVFAAQSAYGDVLLQGTEKAPATAAFGTDGKLEADTIIWSQKYGRVLLPATFTQAAELPDGGSLSITGAAMHVDRDFRRWTYFATQDKPARVDFLPEPKAKD
jgi:hypothetical protein